MIFIVIVYNYKQSMNLLYKHDNYTFCDSKDCGAIHPSTSTVHCSYFNEIVGRGIQSSDGGFSSCTS